MLEIRDYKLINQDENLCLAACLQMILKRRKLYSFRKQEDIVKYFKKEKDDKGNIKKVFINNLNTDFFDHFTGYNLKETYLNFKDIDELDYDFKNLYEKFIHSDCDVIIFTNYKILMDNINNPGMRRFYDNDEFISEANHCFLVNSIFKEYRKDKDEISLTDVSINENYFKILTCPPNPYEINFELICPETRFNGGTFKLLVNGKTIFDSIYYNKNKSGMGISIIENK